MQAPAKNIDEYIARYPADVQVKLQKLRETIQKAIPKATEAISYGIPTFKYHGNLVHFGGFKQHLSFFPGAAGVAAFEKELFGYQTSKGTIQLPLDKPLPLKLIKDIVKFRVIQAEEAAALKGVKKKKRI
jgi:uncharacterized protein YdhG (YjbR/CyaY superfamily)